jgi:hypothetical protein
VLGPPLPVELSAEPAEGLPDRRPDGPGIPVQAARPERVGDREPQRSNELFRVATAAEPRSGPTREEGSDALLERAQESFLVLEEGRDAQVRIPAPIGMTGGRSLRRRRNNLGPRTRERPIGGHRPSPPGATWANSRALQRSAGGGRIEGGCRVEATRSRACVIARGGISRSNDPTEFISGRVSRRREGSAPDSAGAPGDCTQAKASSENSGSRRARALSARPRAPAAAMVEEPP